jgi:hypothetical protein
MGQCPPAARLAGRACGLLGLLMAGCMPFGYAYPTVSYVRAVGVGVPTDEVHAFRVDVADDDNSVDSPEKDEYVLHPLPLHEDGRFDPQVKLAVDYGWMVTGTTLVYDGSTSHTLLVRLYRRGYHTIEIESWQKGDNLKWYPANTIEQREKAIDDLVSTWKTSPIRVQNRLSRSEFLPPRDPIVFRYLAPGTTLDEHQRSLQFAASEYEQLLTEAVDDALRSRLAAKSKELRQIAAK